MSFQSIGVCPFCQKAVDPLNPPDGVVIDDETFSNDAVRTRVFYCSPDHQKKDAEKRSRERTAAGKKLVEEQVTLAKELAEAERLLAAAPGATSAEAANLSQSMGELWTKLKARIPADDVYDTLKMVPVMNRLSDAIKRLRGMAPSS